MKPQNYSLFLYSIIHTDMQKIYRSHCKGRKHIAAQAGIIASGKRPIPKIPAHAR